MVDQRHVVLVAEVRGALAVAVLIGTGKFQQRRGNEHSHALQRSGNVNNTNLYSLDGCNQTEYMSTPNFCYHTLQRMGVHVWSRNLTRPIAKVTQI